MHSATASQHRTFYRSMALFWLFFGLGCTFYPKMMQWFMTPDGIAASTVFSDQVWQHCGLDIFSVCALLLALSTVPATKTTLRLAATVGLLPTAVIVYSTFASPFWSTLFLAPAAGCFAFAVWGFALAGTAKE